MRVDQKDLEPCGTCGSTKNLAAQEAEVVNGTPVPQYYIICNGCGIRGKVSTSVKRAIRYWNVGSRN